MGQRSASLTQIWGFNGFKVNGAYFENVLGERVERPTDFGFGAGIRLVLPVQRVWAARCAGCGAIAEGCHHRRAARRWADLPWGERSVVVEYAPERVKCRRCQTARTELVPWAEPKQRQTRRLQQHIALDAFSMPLLHVATKYGLSWHTVRRAENDAIARWERTRVVPPLRQVGLDEKWLGRRHKRKAKFVTIVSNLESGEPIAIRYGRGADAVGEWIGSLTAEQRAGIKLFAMDMHGPFISAVREHPGLSGVPIVHDPFHVMKRAGEAITELRRQIFFRASAELRAVGRGTRWLVLRAWKRIGRRDRARLRRLFAYNGKLARAYQVVEELREALRAPDRDAMHAGIWRVLRRTERRNNVPMRKLHDSLRAHLEAILALGEHRPPTGRIEAINNNWETLVRRGRGYRDHHYLLRKLRFVMANPVRNRDGIRRFLALGIPAPHAVAA